MTINSRKRQRRPPNRSSRGSSDAFGLKCSKRHTHTHTCVTDCSAREREAVWEMSTIIEMQPRVLFIAAHTQTHAHRGTQKRAHSHTRTYARRLWLPLLALWATARNKNMDERQYKTESLKTRKTNNCAKRNAENWHTHTHTCIRTLCENNELDVQCCQLMRK